MKYLLTINLSFLQIENFKFFFLLAGSSLVLHKLVFRAVLNINSERMIDSNFGIQRPSCIDQTRLTFLLPNIQIGYFPDTLKRFLEIAVHLYIH